MGTNPQRRAGRGGRWAVAMAVLTLICLVVPVLLIRSALLGVRGLEDAGSKAGEAVVASVRSVAEAFRTGKVETSLRSYATQLSGVSRFEFAELKQLESFERKDSATIGWGTIPLPDVVVEARGQVVYTYVLDFRKPWDLRLDGTRVEVTAPAPEFSTPALDPSTLTFETKQGSVLRNEETVRASLQAGLAGLLNQRAREHLPLVRETGRKTTEEFVRNFLLSNYDDASSLSVRVRFADEAAPPPVSPALAIETRPSPESTPGR